MSKTNNVLSKLFDNQYNCFVYNKRKVGIFVTLTVCRQRGRLVRYTKTITS